MDKNHEVYKHKHICLVGDHFNPLAIVRSLGEEGIKPIVLLCSLTGTQVSRSKYIGELHRFTTPNEALEYMVDHYSNEEYKPFVYNGSDDITLLLDNNYNRLKDHFIFTNGAGTIGKYMEKYAQTKAAEEVGLRIPKEELLEVGVLPTTLKYPVMTKAVTSAGGGAWKDQAFICENEEELKAAYSKIHAKQILVQEYIRKKNELCIDGISINGGEQVFMPYGCNYFTLAKDSYGGHIYYTPFENKDLINKITELLRIIKFSGIFCIEFLEGEDGEYYFLEVNLRHSGWGYAYTYGGYNLPVRWAVSTLESKISMEGYKPKKYITAISEFDDLIVMVSSGRENILHWIYKFIKTDCALYSNPRDSMSYYLTVGRFILRALKKCYL